ncbi:heme oxygenase-like protein [Epithele typhae]|uniref:heme oxygenase-like protein n=1 Tax=Epithele typhae TaxID=378194 RepID=UPI002008C678|nr:heme oxygenase-like protein [Epithele typhae]KAH9941754.1 heme oxygenase-like protein [Epithele typhae]
MAPSLTEHLTSLRTARPYAAATQHPFLHAAGTGTLPASTLSLYIAQDRRYAAHAYPRFLGQLLARVPFDTAVNAPRDPAERLAGVLFDALAAVRDEVRLFDALAGGRIPPLGRWPERRATRAYAAEMARVAACGSLEDGLVFLWAMERVYLDSWKYVKSLHSTEVQGTSVIAPVVAELADHWTSPEFEQFVEILEGLVNDCGITPVMAAFRRAEEIWARVIELETDFWPDVTEGDLN